VVSIGQLSGFFEHFQPRKCPCWPSRPFPVGESGAFGPEPSRRGQSWPRRRIFLIKFYRRRSLARHRINLLLPSCIHNGIGTVMYFGASKNPRRRCRQPAPPVPGRRNTRRNQKRLPGSEIFLCAQSIAPSTAAVIGWRHIKRNRCNLEPNTRPRCCKPGQVQSPLAVRQGSVKCCIAFFNGVRSTAAMVSAFLIRGS